MNPPTYDSNIEVVLKTFGYFERDLTLEREFFLQSIERYRKGMISICGSKNIIALWITRENDQLLGNQTFFMPFPENLVEPDPAERIGGVIYGKNRNDRKEFPRWVRTVSEGGIIRRSRPCLFPGRTSTNGLNVHSVT